MANPNIFHTSDLHGSYHGLLTQLAQIENLDIWVDTGDFFPNKTRGTHVEKSYQTKWALEYTKIAHRIAEICMKRNISVVSVSGNHDYVSLANLLKVAGMSANNVFDLSSASHSTTVHGIKFAGFREIPYIAGEWAGETEIGDFKDIMNTAMSHNPDILVTHCPPGGILDDATDGGHYGVPYITSYLMNAPHSVKAHLFGHVHGDGGLTKSEGEILFSNAAAIHTGNVLGEICQ